MLKRWRLSFWRWRLYFREFSVIPFEFREFVGFQADVVEFCLVMWYCGVVVTFWTRRICLCHASPRRRHVPVTHTCYVHRSSGLMGVVQDMVDHNKTTFIIVKCYRLYIGLHSTLRVDLKRTAY